MLSERSFTLLPALLSVVPSGVFAVFSGNFFFSALADFVFNGLAWWVSTSYALTFPSVLFVFKAGLFRCRRTRAHKIAVNFDIVIAVRSLQAHTWNFRRRMVAILPVIPALLTEGISLTGVFVPAIFSVSLILEVTASSPIKRGYVLDFLES